MDLETKICDAIQLIVDKTIARLGYNRTISATIKEKKATPHEYTVTYQKAIFTAFSIGEDTYEIGDKVDVLIQNGDMSKKKLILTKS